MREEISAGAIVFKKRKEKTFFLLLKDQNGNWSFPKGLIEDGEEGKIAAQRETGEETGIFKTEFCKELSLVQYWYRWEGDLIKKTVHYYLFETSGEEKFKPQEEEGISEVRWFSPKEAWQKIGYRKTNEKILTEAFAECKIEGET